MNLQIKELAEGAWDSARDEFGSFVDDGGEVNWDFLHAYDKKFAELIVKECLEVVFEQKKWVEDMIVFDPRDKEWNLAKIQQSQRIVDKINEHFEVEE